MAKKILVADDDRAQRDLYVELFENNGFHVISADDGLEALDKALKEPPDLIFTGIIMPRMDGFELIRELRNNISTSFTPIIMFSHLGRSEDRKRAKKLINLDFMVKGVDSPAQILIRVKKILFGPKKKLEPPPESDPRKAVEMI